MCVPSALELVNKTRFSEVSGWVFRDMFLQHSPRKDGWVWVALAVKSWRAGEHMLCGDRHFTLMYMPPEANQDNVIQAMKQQLASLLRKGHMFEGQFAGNVTCWGDSYACVSLQVLSQLYNSLHNIAQAGLSAGGRVLSKPWYKKADWFHLSVSSRDAPSEEVILPIDMLLALEGG